MLEVAAPPAGIGEGRVALSATDTRGFHGKPRLRQRSRLRSGRCHHVAPSTARCSPGRSPSSARN
eukprot:8425235-Alexandrium_andersonii.AAC.1